MALSFERVITRYELENRCILLRDDKKTDHSKEAGAGRLSVQAGGRSYSAQVRDYYVDAKFQAGLYFEAKPGEGDFFFEQSVTLGKRARIKGAGAGVLEVEVYIPEK